MPVVVVPNHELFCHSISPHFNIVFSYDASTGVVTINTFRGGSTIRCTYPDGCYNEVLFIVMVPFTMRTKIPAGGSSFTLSPQMSSGECFIDWGDANSETLTGSTNHSYATS
eukprot:COSAG01_NODE_24898_length_762_cov_1.366516_1_plen_111_part_10